MFRVNNYAKTLIAITILGSFVAIIVGGSKEVLRISTRSHHDNGNNRIESSGCRKIISGSYDCTDGATKEAAKKVTQWYIYAETKNVITTGYNSVEAQTDASPCIAADGRDICSLKKHGENACAFAVPFGTRIKVPGLGSCTVHDKTAKRYHERLDWYFGGADRIAEALVWGKQRKEVLIEYPYDSPRIQQN